MAPTTIFSSPLLRPAPWRSCGPHVRPSTSVLSTDSFHQFWASVFYGVSLRQLLAAVFHECAAAERPFSDGRGAAQFHGVPFKPM
jgi:hypothetical protein